MMADIRNYPPENSIASNTSVTLAASDNSSEEGSDDEDPGALKNLPRIQLLTSYQIPKFRFIAQFAKYFSWQSKREYTK